MINSIDHVVLTSNNIEKTIFFYCNILEMILKKQKNGKGHKFRYSLHFGKQKINLHEKKNIFSPHAKIALPGTLDICFISKKDLSYWQDKLIDNEIKIIEGPIERHGAQKKLLSIYCRDPDKNLIEISNIVGQND